MKIGIMTACCNCPHPVAWSPDGGWRHLHGGSACDETRRTGAAPPDGAGRCPAVERVDGGLAVCDGPPDGHQDHAARVVLHFSTLGGAIKPDEWLHPARRWSTP
jgi:hypothetical protein